MANMVLIGLLVSSLVGGGFLGTMMIGGYDMGMMDDGFGFGPGRGMMGGRGSCPMMGDHDNHYEECEDHMGEYCSGNCSEECDEYHEDCEADNHQYCEQYDDADEAPENDNDVVDEDPAPLTITINA